MVTVGVIYALCDPDTGEVRYVGKTSSRDWRRYCEGKYSGAIKHPEPKRWVDRWLCTLNEPPSIIVLDRGPVQWLDALEREWIAYCRRMGYRLTNLTDGGDGGDTSAAFTKETKRKMSEGQRNKNLSKQSESLKRSSALKAHHDRLRGIPRTQEERDKISATLRGKKHTSIHRQRNKEAHIGQVPWNKKVVV